MSRERTGYSSDRDTHDYRRYPDQDRKYDDRSERNYGDRSTKYEDRQSKYDDRNRYDRKDDRKERMSDAGWSDRYHKDDYRRTSRDTGYKGEREKHRDDAADRKYNDRKYNDDRKYDDRKSRDDRRYSKDVRDDRRGQYDGKDDRYDKSSRDRDNQEYDEYYRYKDRRDRDRSGNGNRYKKASIAENSYERYQRKQTEDQRSKDRRFSEADSGYNGDVNKYPRRDDEYSERNRYAESDGAVRGGRDSKYKQDGSASRFTEGKYAESDGGYSNKGYDKAVTISPNKVKVDFESSIEESSMSRKSAVVDDDDDDVGECCGSRRNRIISGVVILVILLLAGLGITAAIVLSAEPPERTIDLYGSLRFFNSTILREESISSFTTSSVYSDQDFCNQVNATLTEDPELADLYRGCDVITPGSLVDYSVSLVGTRSDGDHLSDLANKAINASVTGGLLYDTFGIIHVIFTLSLNTVEHIPTTIAPLPCADNDCKYFEMCIDDLKNNNYSCVCTQCLCPDGNFSTTECPGYNPEDFSCEDMPTERFNFPNPANCQQYLACQDSGESKNMTCPYGGDADLIFDPQKDRCEEITEGRICYRPSS